MTTNGEAATTPGPEKPPARVITSDDYEVWVDGHPYRPHRGEAVTFAPRPSVGETLDRMRMGALSVELDAARGDSDEALQVRDIMNRTYEDVIAALADRILDWTWTDDQGERYPNPHGKPTVLRRITDGETAYLMSCAKGESPEDEKKDLNDSPTTSSDTAPPTTQPLATVPSPPKG